jgi:tetratricopeptide (TPR) repeat protein
MTSRPAATSAENQRIDSWKEIAAFFGRDERTVKRWEKERGLPVHRLPGERGGVFAWSLELTAWLNSASGKSEPAAPPATAAPEPLPEPGTTPVALKTPRRTLFWTASMFWTASIAAALLIAATIAGVILLRHHSRNRAAVSELHPAVASAPHHVPDPEAQQFYLKGRYYWSRRTPDSLRQAIDAFTQAVVHDSDYAQAYAGLAECYDLMPEFTSMPRSEAFPRAIAASRKAVALDDSLAEAHRALGFALFYWEWRVPAALAEYQRAIALDPRDEEAHHWYATSLLTLGRFQEARAEIDQAQQLDPASRSILCDQALIHFSAGETAPAIEKLREMEQSEPEFLSVPRYLAGIAFTQRDYRTFIAQSRRLADLSGDKQLLAIANAAASGLARGGERALLDATRLVQQQYFDSGQSSGFELALTCARLGRTPDAVAALKGAIAAHDYNVMSIATNPGFSSLQRDPAFQDLLRQITERIYRA